MEKTVGDFDKPPFEDGRSVNGVDVETEYGVTTLMTEMMTLEVLFWVSFKETICLH